MKYGLFWLLLSPDGGVTMNYKKILAVLFALAAFAGTGSAFAQTPYGMPITLDQAKKAMTAAIAALKVNSAYEGYTNTSLLVPTQENSSFYMPGDSIVCVRIEFEIDPTKTNKYPWSSQASVTPGKRPMPRLLSAAPPRPGRISSLRVAYICAC